MTPRFPNGSERRILESAMPGVCRAAVILAAVGLVLAAPSVARAATVTVTISPTGSGTVTDAADQIACPGDCTGVYKPFTRVTLTADPRPGWRFGEWGRDCSVGRVKEVCAFLIALGRFTYDIDASFVNDPPSPPTSVTASATSTTTIRVRWSGATDDTRVVSFDVFRDGASPPELRGITGTEITDTVAPGSTHTYTVRSRDLPGLVSGTSVAARATTPATVTVSIDGRGSVTSAPAGIDCGAICNATFAGRAAVTLFANPATGFNFAGWGGACSGTGVCSLSMTANHSVTATFIAQPPPSPPEPPKPPPTPTPPKPPPPQPRKPPSKYGVVASASIKRIKDGLQATYVFRTLPLPRSQLQAVWYYNNKPVGSAPKTRRQRITSFARSKAALPPGWWRCALRVKIPGGGWKTVKEARIRLS